MIVTVEEDVFVVSADDLDLYQLIRFGFQERHYLLIDPPFDPCGTRPVNQWLARHGRRLRDAIQKALEFGMEAETTGPSPRPKTKVRVASIPRPNWELAVPKLPLGDACRLLETPLRLLVENRRNEGAFLRAYAKPDQLQRLKHAESQGWIEFVQGGGLPEILHHVREVSRVPMHALRLWVMFDSDARAPFDPKINTEQPHGPSSKSRKVRRVCTRARGNLAEYAHQLQRRSIENYVPAQVLREWAKKSARQKTKVNAFLSMTATQRYYFNMKEGFAADRNSNPPGIAPLFSGVDQHEHLQSGFSRLADYFHEKEFKIRQEWIQEELKELEPIIDSIFERM